MVSNSNTTIDLNAFSFKEEGPLQIVLERIPEVTEADVDAYIFTYVVSAPSKGGAHISAISDIDDVWVQQNFPSLGTVAQLRGFFKNEIELRNEEAHREAKYRACENELVKRLLGEIPKDLIDECVDAARPQYEQRMMDMGFTREAYLASEHIDSTEYDQRVLNDVVHNLKAGIALDKVVANQGITVEFSEITQYLSSDDPESFMQGIEVAGLEEEACRAAARVKAMRNLCDAAIVEHNEFAA